MTRQEEKQQLRSVISRLEEKLSPSYKEKSDRVIAHRLLAMPEYQEAQTVFCFIGTAHEINTRPILEHILSSGKTLCVPLCTAPGIMVPGRSPTCTSFSPARTLSRSRQPMRRW